MANGTDRYRSHRNRARIRDIFWREWDPIGINNNETAKDEYDAYADKAYVMLVDERKSESEINSYLYWVASDHMGLGDRPLLKDHCAVLLISLWSSCPRLKQSRGYSIRREIMANGCSVMASKAQYSGRG